MGLLESALLKTRLTPRCPRCQTVLPLRAYLVNGIKCQKCDAQVIDDPTYNAKAAAFTIIASAAAYQLGIGYLVLLDFVAIFLWLRFKKFKVAE